MVINVSLNTRKSQQQIESSLTPRTNRQPADPFALIAPSVRDELLLSSRITDLEAGPIVLERLLSNVENFVDPSQKFLLQGGKPEFDSAMAKAAGTSPEAIAERLLEGITGYIYRAWRARIPQPTEDDVQEFGSQVSTGYDKGFADAWDILEGLKAPHSRAKQQPPANELHHPRKAHPILRHHLRAKESIKWGLTRAPGTQIPRYALISIISYS